ncbi:hypothetical protein HNQ56_003362 [Anaerotaenia torta]|uniref:DUF5695 domain-containing protein n=1 Tax=Anaerotaenia torta TaxID=433293 RepID=UPI003D1F2C8D
MYYLTNRYFDIKVSKGELFALSSPRDTKGTQFIGKDMAFAKALISYETAEGERKEFFPSEQEKYRETEPQVIAKRKLFYQGQAQDGCLEVESEYSLRDEELHHRLRVKNIADTKLVLCNVSLDMPCNSEVSWDESATAKVIGHHYIGGHGSHSTFIRCDGKGPFLVLMPENRTAVSRFDTRILKGEKDKECLNILVYPRDTRISLEPGEEKLYEFVYTWAEDYEDAREVFVRFNQVDVDVVPGLTVPRRERVLLSLRCRHELALSSQYSGQTKMKLVAKNGDRSIYEVILERLGENRVTVNYLDGRTMYVDFFVTEALESLIKKRGAFIADKQHKNPQVWYNGLLAEWNNKTGVMLGPDHYDDIKGWRIYEVTCDDPGLSKPAFLSGKLREYPVQAEVDALEYYVENFVWGGLQQTEEEPYPYGIYGIPDWYTNRNSKDEGLRGKLHLWRIYDYPHIALMYYNLYRVARDYKDITTKLSAETYLYRAYRTALAMFLIPSELEEWSAYKTGLYNECVIPEIVSALEQEDRKAEARRLSMHWNRKVKYFVLERSDVFQSEYPFDTTGFESTNFFAKDAYSFAERKEREDRWDKPVPYRSVVQFHESQMDCNIACRGWLEPAYYWYGSDYRGRNNAYLLSYMSQMGGMAILDYALYYSEEPYSLLRLAYGSLLSSWALLNSGDEESNYGYWFPGKQHDGAAGGGFEPMDHGITWLGQEHGFGSWYYSCEIDLGFCGALRGNAMILAKDPVFGTVLYGGSLEEKEDEYIMTCWDGIGRRFHYVGPEGRIHIEADKGHFSAETPMIMKKDLSGLSITLDETGLNPGSTDCKQCVQLKIMTEGLGDRELCIGQDIRVLKENEEVVIDLPITGAKELLTIMK